MELRVLYFAWLREKIGHAQEVINGISKDTSVLELMEHLSSKSVQHADAFSNPAAIRVAVNQEHVSILTPLSDNDEVAFFPPVTGG